MHCNILVLVKVCIISEMEAKFVLCALQESGSLHRYMFLKMLQNESKLLTYFGA